MTKRRGRRAGLRSFAAGWRRLIVILIAAAALVVLRVWREPQQPAPLEALAEGVYRVQRVVDGDTLLLDNHVRVRLIGVDTPETVKPDHPLEAWGPEATEFTRQFVASGEVRLQFDRQRVDKYGRTLAYVWVGDKMLNEALVRAGLAVAEPQYQYSKVTKAVFLAAQAEAQEAGRGIWSRRRAATGNL